MAADQKNASHLPNFFVRNDLFGGCYQINALLGKGAFGQVYRAWDHIRSCEVAIKFSHVAELRSEGDLLSILCPLIKVPQVFDVGRAEGYWFLAMEYIDGVTLRDLICAYHEQGRRMSVDEVLNTAISLLAHLVAMHDRLYPIVFCDLKPENILLTAAGNVYLVDFGIARHDPHWSKLKAGEKIFGTPPYMAPEYAQDHYITPRVDIYALGVILYELLTGDLPLSSWSYQFKTLRGPLGSLVMQMLHPHFDGRPAKARTLKKTFEQILTQRQGRGFFRTLISPTTERFLFF